MGPDFKSLNMSTNYVQGSEHYCGMDVKGELCIQVSFYDFYVVEMET